MKIFKIDVDVNNYQWLQPHLLGETLNEAMNFDCYKMKAKWPQVNWFSLNPKNRKGNFFALDDSGAFGFDQEVYDSELITHLEMAGEILPIIYKKTQYYVLNVLECVEALDEDKTLWEYYDNGERSNNIIKHEFYDDRMSESTLFKIPETSKVDIFTYVGLKDPEDEFKPTYERLGFTGLKFEEVFST